MMKLLVMFFIWCSRFGCVCRSVWNKFVRICWLMNFGRLYWRLVISVSWW